MHELLRRRGSEAAVIASVAVYILAFRFLHDIAGPVVDALAIVPVVIAAWSFGPIMVVTVSLLVGLISALAFVGVGTEPNAAMRSAFIAAVAFALVGSVLSYARQSQRSIARLLATDQATGLLNRAAFVRSLEASLRAGRPATSDLVVIDIVHFRQITETFGHEMGDELLRAIGQRLRDNAEGDARVARIGSDKFLIRLRAGLTPMHSAQAVLGEIGSPLRAAGDEGRRER